MKSHTRVTLIGLLMAGLLAVAGAGVAQASTGTASPARLVDGNSRTTLIGQPASASATASAPSSQITVAGWSGWSEVPGAGQTYDAPGSVTYGGQQYVFVRGTNNLIYRNIKTAGSWTGWSEVPGAGATYSAPTAAVYRNQLYIFVRGTDNLIYRNIDTAGSWTGWSEVPGAGATYSAPTADAYRNQLYIFVRGTDNRIYLNVLGP